jgi:hypothetical protein
MSQENIETAKRTLEAIARSDFDAALVLVHRDIELYPPGGQAPLRGIESFRRWLQPDAFEEQVIEPLEFIDAGEQKVLGRQHIRARGTTSRIELEITSWTVWTFDEDGLITRAEIYLPHEEERAREAAGL